MDQGLYLKPAFDLQLNIGECKRDGALLHFPLVGGKLKTLPGFTPQLESTDLSGSDNATLDKDKRILWLNVEAEAKIESKAQQAETEGITLRWKGGLEIGPSEASILAGGDFVGETQRGKPIISLELEAKGEQYSDINIGKFIGEGRFVVTREQTIIEYRVYQAVVGI